MKMFNRKPKAHNLKIAVLGVGPAGIFSAMALKELGVRDVTMIALDLERSPMHGAQYLHEPIPGTSAVNTPGIDVHYNLLGTADQYRERVYGDSLPSDEEVSAYHLVGVAPSWDIRESYSEAFDLVTSEYQFSSDFLTPTSVVRVAMKYDLVVSSIPAPSLCGGGCTFASQEIWVAGEAPELGIRLPRFRCKDMNVYCNGQPMEDGPSWYRISNLFGRKTVEWPGNIPHPPIDSVAQVKKPLFHNCKCLPDNFIRVGRYGAWQKGYLSHQAFHQTKARVEGMTR